MLLVLDMLRRAFLVAALGMSFSCGGGGSGGEETPASAVPEGRCEKDSDCKPGERCAEVAMICDAPPSCGACVPAPR
jgi:hypothetical protein